MDIREVTASLADERCGLYFLAGLDSAGTADGRPVLTVHATEGAINLEHERFIVNDFAAAHPDLDVRIRLHSTTDLYTPGSLEDFARAFDHDHIVSDPTGAFARVSKLLMLAGSIRTELAGTVSRIFWRSDDSALVVVASPADARPPYASRDPQWFEELRRQIDLLIEKQSCSQLRKTIASVRVCDKVPSGRYSIVDAASQVVRPQERKVAARGRRLASMLARISGIAALVGLGTFSVAHARTPTIADNSELLLPGITGLVGLTTLGENSFGFRNRYQAMGGLRLYFGDTGVLTGLAFRPGSLRFEGPILDDLDSDGLNGAWPKLPKPPRIMSVS